MWATLIGCLPYVTPLGIEPSTLRCTGWHSHRVSLARAPCSLKYRKGKWPLLLLHCPELSESLQAASLMLLEIPRLQSATVLGNMLSIFVFWGTSILFSVVIVPIYIPSNSAQGFSSLHLLAFVISCLFFKTTNIDLLPTVLEAGSLRSGCQHGWALVRALLLAWRWLPSCCVLTWWRETCYLLSFW